MRLICRDYTISTIAHPVGAKESEYTVKGLWAQKCSLGTVWIALHSGPATAIPGGNSRAQKQQIEKPHATPCAFIYLLNCGLYF